MIPRIDAARLGSGDPAALAETAVAAREIGFLTLHNTAISVQACHDTLAAYRSFFALPLSAKRRIDMARTGSNRGWGAPGAEQVDPAANPDYKQVFDCGLELPAGHPMARHTVYAPNLWPADLPGFRPVIERYMSSAMAVSRQLLSCIIRAVGMDHTHFMHAFETPMALLRGNFYPARPLEAGPRDFGIATHTDYGCLTLLTGDGTPGLEVRQRGGGWIPVETRPGEFVVNFGEMLEMWTDGAVRATPHRVVGSDHERLSVPLFFNPDFETNVAPVGSGKLIRAGDHLSQRFAQTYRHLQRRAG